MLRKAASVTWLAVFLAVYLPSVGHGFLRDDAGWILDSRVRQFSDLGGVALGGEGFYRPVVAVTFALTEPFFGNRPLGYSLTNVALALLVAWAIFRLARTLGLQRGAALVAAAVWLLNYHGVSWGVQWISGRTSLVATAGAVLAAERALAGGFWWSALWLCVAFFAKEEALAMGAVIVAWLAILKPKNGPHLYEYAACVALCAGAYLWLRNMSGAMTPFDAPDYYRFTFDPATLLRNAAEYADRALTTSLLAAAVGVIALGRPQLDGRGGRILGACAIWVAGGYAVTLWLPVRSDLYALLPSVGACLAAAGVVGAAWERAAPARRKVALAAAVVGPLLLSPMYWARAQRRVALGDLSTRAMTRLAAQAAARPDPLELSIADVPDPHGRPGGLDAALGGSIEETFYLWTGRQARITVLH